MDFQDALTTSTRSLAHGKMRSVLTMLGIVIGIASVIILMSVGQSAQDYILNQVKGIGSDLIFVIPGAPTNGRFSSPAQAQGIIITTLNKRDADNLRREPSIIDVEPEVRGQASAVYGNNNVTVTYEGVDAGFFPVRNFTIGKGAQFSQSDVDSRNHVAVIGPDLATTLFGPYVDPVGKTLRLKDVTFRIVGVLAKGGTTTFGIDQGNIVVIPVTVAQAELLGITYYNDLIIQANPAYDSNFVKTRVATVVRRDHSITDPRKDDFQIETQQDIVSLLGSITSVLTLFLAAIAGISLVVGGIGIMNIMLVSVTERTKEIGLRKAVGATDRDILEQFLIESVILTVVGGVIGIALGSGITGLIYLGVVNLSTISWTFELPPTAIGLALGVSALSGIAFGLYPARNAAKKNPIEALKYE
ncbi:MAG: ABC transporter permease [Patescibacteria group bacterium]|nr:ABC transporter permease [Patescibacteria group bacterium]